MASPLPARIARLAVALLAAATGALAQGSAPAAGLPGAIPTPLFSAQPRSGAAPLTVRFTDESRGHVTAWHWKFGDGASSEERHPEHVYAATGTYTVVLTASGPAGSRTLRKQDLILVGDCPAGSARENVPMPLELGADYVPIHGDDALGFWCVYSGKKEDGDLQNPANNVGIFLFELAPDHVLVFGSGYGDVPGPDGAFRSAAHDAWQMNEVMRWCMGMAPSRTSLTFVAPHGHPDHINPAIVRELEVYGYTVLDIYYHEADTTLVDLLSWTQSDRRRLRPLVGERCGEELLAFDSPIGRIWFYLRPGHTAGSIDLVLDTLGDPENRVVVLGSLFNQACPPPGGVRETIAAHGNVLLDAPPPLLGSLSPVRGSSQGGTTVTITGGNFLADRAGPVAVEFGDLTVPAQILDDATLVCEAPSGTPLTSIDVRLVNRNGSAERPGGFGFNPPPRLVAIEPASGSPVGGTRLSLSGSGFSLYSAGDATVTFAGVPATDVEVLDDTTLLCTSPPGAALSDATVAVSNRNGTAELPGVFRYGPGLRVTDGWPTAGTPLGGTLVTVLGTGFQSGGAFAPSVRFGETAALDVVVWNDGVVTCSSPPGAAGASVDLRLVNENGLVVVPGAFTYHPNPRIDSVTPELGPHTGGTDVAVNGAGFVDRDAGSPIVRFGAVEAENVQVLNDTRLRCTVPQGTAGELVAVSVTNENGTGSRGGSFLYEPILLANAFLPASASSLGGTPITLEGMGFEPGTTVRFGASSATGVRVLDSTRLTCLTPPGTPGSLVDVTLENTLGSSVHPGAFRYHPPPVLTGIAPLTGPGAGGTEVLLLGVGFLSDGASQAEVLLGDADAMEVVVLSDTLVRATTPPGPPGATVDVRLRNVNGEARLPASFRYADAPSIASVEPSTAPANTSVAVTLTGTGFLPADSGPAPAAPLVLFGRTEAADVVVHSDGRLTCTSPRALLGSVDVSIHNANGVAVAPDAFEVQSEPLVLRRAVPSDGIAAGGTTIRILGSGFNPEHSARTSVVIGGEPATAITVLDPETIECTVPPGPPNTQVPIEIRSPAGYALSLTGWRYRALPTIETVEPPSGSLPGGESITLSGFGFLDDDAGPNTVLFGAVPATDVLVLGDKTIVCTNPAGLSRGPVDLTVRNRNGETVLPGGFVYIAPAPLLQAVAPPSGTSLGGSTVQLTGKGFAKWSPGALSVRFGEVLASDVVVLDDTRATCTAPPGPPDTQVSVSVMNANGEASRAGAWTYHPRPTVTGVLPGVGSADGGTRVTVLGTGFVEDAAGTSLVTLDGAPVLDVLVADDTTLTFTTPPMPTTPGSPPPGTPLDLKIQNANGEASAVGSFAYVAPPPTLGGLAPASAPASGGSAVTLEGSGFTRYGASAHEVLFGGLPASDVAVLDDGTLTCTLPSGTPGGTVDVVYRNTSGEALLAGAFRYHERPSLAAIAPARASALGGSTVTLTGAGFLRDMAGANEVLFGDVPAPSVSVVSDTELTCLVPAGTPGALVGLTLRNANGEGALAPGFTFNPSPRLTSIDPPSGPETGRTRVILHGADLASQSPGTILVRFGGIDARNVRIVDASTIECETPAGQGFADVELYNANGSTLLPGAFTFLGDPPTLSDLSPTKGPANGGTLVTLTGTGFPGPGGGVPRVLFGDSPATGVVLEGSTTLRCLSPSGPPRSNVDVTVENANGSDRISRAFRYNAQQSLTALEPIRGPSLGKAPTILRGSGFDASTSYTILVGGEEASAVRVLDDERIAFRTPPGEPARTASVRVFAGEVDLGSLAYLYDPHPSDLDADGVDDRVVALPDEGALRVSFGGADGRETRVTGLSRLAPGFAVGDLSGDGLPDLVVTIATPQRRAVVLLDGPLPGSGHLEAEVGRALVEGEPEHGRLGESLAVADLDGDGSLELLVGEPGASRVWIVTPPAGPDDPYRLLERSTGALDHDLGARLLPLDVDGDGASEWFASAPRSERGGSDAGALFGFAGFDHEPRWSWLGDEPAARFGAEFAFGAFDCRPEVDLAVAAPGSCRFGAGGAVHVFHAALECPYLHPSESLPSREATWMLPGASVVHETPRPSTESPAPPPATAPTRKSPRTPLGAGPGGRRGTPGSE